MSPGPPTPPIGNITLEVTHRCHRRCTFCYLPGLAHRDARTCVELTAEQIIHAALTVIDASGCKRIQLSGGEPLLRPDLATIAVALAAHGADLSVLTDGAQLDESRAKELVASGVRAIQPTLLAARPDVHDELRGTGAFRDVTRAIAAAAASGLEVSVCMVVTRRNFDQAADVAALAFALGARGLALSRYCPAGAASTASARLMPDALHVRQAAEAAARVCRDIGLPLAAAVTVPSCVWSDPEHPPLKTGVCSLAGPKATVTIGPEGSIRSCSLSTRSVGNILSDAWETCWQRLWEQQLEPVRASCPPSCAGCAWLSRCLGGCRMSALAASGSLAGPDPLALGPVRRTR